MFVRVSCVRVSQSACVCVRACVRACVRVCLCYLFPCQSELCISSRWSSACSWRICATAESFVNIIAYHFQMFARNMFFFWMGDDQHNGLKSILRKNLYFSSLEISQNIPSILVLNVKVVFEGQKNLKKSPN